MSKTCGNFMGPDQLVETHGADAVRSYILFMGPADQDMEWTEEGVEGIARFLRRLWRRVNEVAEQAPREGSPEGPLARKAHETIAKVSDDIGRRFVFNTPIAAVMELVNALAPATDDPAARLAAETVVSLIQPYAPHIAEELWRRGGCGRVGALSAHARHTCVTNRAVASPAREAGRSPTLGWGLRPTVGRMGHGVTGVLAGTRTRAPHVRQCADADAQRREARPTRAARLPGRGRRALLPPLAFGLAGRVRPQRPPGARRRRRPGRLRARLRGAGAL